MQSADLVLKSDAVFTGAEGSVLAGGVAVKGNRIAAVGTARELESWIGARTTVREFGDRLIMPGIIDAHMHFFAGAFSSSPYMLMDLFEAHSEKESAAMVEKFAKEHPDYDRIAGMGWCQAFWTPGAPLPHRASLDAVVPDRPVYLLSADAHTFWLNTKALEQCGITKETKVSFGSIGRDGRGELSGLLFEIEAEASANENSFRLPPDEQKRITVDFLKQLSRSGVTSTVNMSASPVLESDFREYEMLRELERAGKLPVRLHLFPSMGLDNGFARVRELRESYRSERLRVAGLKHFVDGVTSTYSAFLLAPYSDNPGTSGFTNYSSDFYRRSVVNANREGFGVRLHAIGDASVRLALDAFEESRRVNGNGPYRNTIEHVESIHPDDIPRFARLGVIASVQPIHLPFDRNEKISRIGKERCRYEWPFRSLLDAGAVLAFGTDFPVAPINPFPNIHAAVTRRTPEGEPCGANPEERISLAEALRAYTSGSAWALHRESDLGTLEPGKLADIVVLDRNLFTVAEDEIADASVVVTVSDGAIVYQST